jgi:hypothetical protein
MRPKWFKKRKTSFVFCPHFRLGILYFSQKTKITAFFVYAIGKINNQRVEELLVENSKVICNSLRQLLSPLRFKLI